MRSSCQKFNQIFCIDYVRSSVVGDFDSHEEYNEDASSSSTSMVSRDMARMCGALVVLPMQMKMKMCPCK